MRHKFSTRLRRQKQFRQKTLSNLALFLVVLVPIYPAFGSYMQGYTGVVVRGEYDRSTILDSYDWTTGEATSDVQDVIDITPETTLIAPDPAPLPEPTTVSAQQEPQAIKDPKRALYVTHTVARGDTLSTIAEKYDIPVATLRMMNQLGSSDILSINQKIIIPRINGVQYVVQKGDTLSVIAQKYGVKDVNSIAIANDMSPRSTLTVGHKLLLPNPTKDPNKKPPVQVATIQPVKKPVPTRTTTTISKAPVKVAVKDPPVITYGGYSLSLKINK